MFQRFLTARSPLRLLEKGLHGGLGKGKVGVVLAGPGVGKTAFLVGAALDDLLRGDRVLHIVLDQTVQHTRAYYDNLMPANRLELLSPMFSLYSGMFDACALAAEQQWGSKGIWIPETTFFNGPENLPDDIAAELRDLMLVRKPFEERTARFQWFAETKNRHNSRWNFQADGEWDHGHYVARTKGRGIFGHTTHILGPSARIVRSTAAALRRRRSRGEPAGIRSY